MNRSIIWRLIAKDLYLQRWIIVISMVGGLAALFMNRGDGVPDVVGLILFVTAVVAAGIFVAMYGVLTERQVKSLLFVLSLPVSPMQYTFAKVAASLIAFLIPWAVFTATILGLTIAFDPPPDGSIPWTVTMMLFFLAIFCMLLTLLLVTRSEYWAIAGIMVTNFSVAAYLNIVPRLAGIDVTNPGPVAVWSTPALSAIGIEVAVIVLSLALVFYVQSRRKDIL